MRPPHLYLSRDQDLGYLCALEFGRVPDGQPPACWLALDEHFAYHRPPRARGPRGFHIRDLDSFDPYAPDLAEIWSEPRFDVPLLGLHAVSAGEIAIAAAAHFGSEPSINRTYFDAATNHQGEDALALWRCCLEAGDQMAHFAIGYTLLELGREHEAYGHLRHYVDLAPYCSWNWCWFGKAAAAIGETVEARRAFQRAISLTRRGDDETDAPDLLARLIG